MAASLGVLNVLGAYGCPKVFGLQKKLENPSVGSLEASALRSPFKGRELVMPKQLHHPGAWTQKSNSTSIQAAICNIPRSMRWWLKNAATSNMKDINSADELVQTLRDAEDKLVIVIFYSPSCGGYKPLHPMICEVAEVNTDVMFLKVNAEDHREMCICLSVHVFPVFRFYRGAEGRVCNMSCTPETIKKFKDAVARYNKERDSVGPAKGLEESQLKRLASLMKTE